MAHVFYKREREKGWEGMKGVEGACMFFYKKEREGMGERGEAIV